MLLAFGAFRSCVTDKRWGLKFENGKGDDVYLVLFVFKYLSSFEPKPW